MAKRYKLINILIYLATLKPDAAKAVKQRLDAKMASLGVPEDLTKRHRPRADRKTKAQGNLRIVFQVIDSLTADHTLELQRMHAIVAHIDQSDRDFYESSSSSSSVTSSSSSYSTSNASSTSTSSSSMVT